MNPDENANYYAEFVVDLDIDEPMIADSDVNNKDMLNVIHMILFQIYLSMRVKHIDLGFVGSCMVHKGDIKIVAKMLKFRRKFRHS